MDIRTDRLNHFIVALILFGVVLITYSNSLHNPFMMDDDGLILQDNKIHNLKFWYYQFIPDRQIVLRLEGGGHDNYYRPLAHILPMLGYFLFGRNTFGYHVVNLILFGLVCLSIYVLIVRLFGNKNLALWTALLFAVHPINSLIVNYITASVFAIQLLALIWSTILFLKAQEKERNILLIPSLLLFVIAILCHETSMVFPLCLASSLIIAHKNNFKTALIKCLPFFFIVAAYLIFRMYFASLKTSIWDKFFLYHMNFLQYWATFTKLIVWYFMRIVLLTGTVIIWATPIVREHVGAWIFFSTLLFIGAAVIYSLQSNNLERRWGLVWILIGFLPVTAACFFQPRYGLMIEPHWLFFPSIGVFVILASAMLSLRNPNLSTIFKLLIMTLLIINTRNMNRLWSSEKQYCQYWVKGFPGCMFYLASAYMKEGDYRPAREYYPKALENSFFDWEIVNNMGLMDFKEGKNAEAIEYFKKALEIAPKSTTVLNNLGLAYWKNNQIDLAKECFTQAIDYNRFYLEPRFNLAQIYQDQGAYRKARDLYLENFSIDPQREDNNYFLAEVYFKTNQPQEAVAAGKKILKESTDSSTLTRYGSLFAANRYNNLAFELFLKSIQIPSSSPDTYLELGKFLGNQGKWDEALMVWQEGLKRNPSDGRFEALINEIKRFKEEGK